METRTLTRSELNRRIAELREPKPTEPRGVTPPTFKPTSSDLGEWIHTWSGTCLGWLPRKDYSIDANTALELLSEMPWLDIRHLDDAPIGVDYRISWRAGIEAPERHTTIYGECAITFCVAVALAYYEWKTGERVELTD